MQASTIKSLFKNNLLRLKPSQKEGYLIKDLQGNILVININTEYTQNKISLLYESFNDCMFYNIDLVASPSVKNTIECIFINRDNLNYNPYMDVVNMRLISRSLSALCNRKNTVDKLSQITVQLPNINGRIKYELLIVFERMLSKFLKDYKIIGSLRLALYESEDCDIKIDVVIFKDTQNPSEMYLDELYFFS